MEEINHGKYKLKSILKDKALELGFQQLSVADYRVLKNEIRNYNKWLSENMNATMNWMERNIEKREDIRQIIPEAKSVIALAHSYFTGNIHPKVQQNESGKISRYAWGSDYHDILINKMRLLENEILNFEPSARLKSYVDTGPLLEKQWASISGLGWQGKNSLIINKNFGSYFFIGIIITNLDLPSDPMAKDFCGTCTRCIDACPTKAIVNDKVVDSRKCISYWTIEAKPDIEIPDGIATNSKNWIYGCDICQEVCPWNKHKPVITSESLFKSRLEDGSLLKKEIENMEQQDFSRLFKNSPVKRLKIAGLKRNANSILKY
ncbi:MAG: tRNA epoxyqueuosine(34) reductase QueG [Candidatus Kapabacteria bacterium]|nr:tRNA epoxyqueuosine(34) reductase QueG [Ignavibacteriota bacterium]MCW5884133.1 tRNA epoxyqueuosine(34) reductase QueG [Candidatus Kapabacteria bacterium]